MVELLAPAGEYNSLIGAISAGADAVYLAGNMYGARASAVNFTEEEIIKGLRYAHLFNRKIYLTVNTLTKQIELENLYDFLRPLYLSGLDGVIVQDIGVIKYIKECFPKLDIHVSTQACVTSPEGALFYKDLGAVRVVPARELTLNEIKDITATGMETECFIHGAMCYGYSGLCLFSSFLGGNSGNRGRCKGPCRQPYQLDGKDEYLLSLKDMSTIQMMNRLIDANIYSFKIEGRLKSPSYSAGVTKVYRKAIDYCLEHPGKAPVLDKADIDLLNNLYSRSGSLTGYYDMTSSKKMITINGGAYNKVSDEDEKDIFEKYVNNNIKCPVNVKFKANPGESASFEIETNINGIRFNSSVQSDQIIEVSKNPVNTDNILKNIKKFGNTDFVLDKCEIETNNGFVPASMINNLRRDAVDKLEYQINLHLSSREDDCKAISFDEFSSDDIDSFNMAFVDNLDQLKTCIESGIIDKYVVGFDLYDNLDNINCSNLYLEMPPVYRKQNKELFIKLAKFVDNNDNFKGVFVNQNDAYRLLKDIGFNKEICSNTNIYSYNKLAYLNNKNNYKYTLAPIELDLKNIKDVECYDSLVMMYGKAPLMQSANCILKTKDLCAKYSKYDNNSFVYMKDRLKVSFPVRLRCSDYLCFNTIYNSKPNSLHKYYNTLKNAGFNRFYFRFTDESITELHSILSYFKDILSGIDKNPEFDYTNGHIKGGIL